MLENMEVKKDILQDEKYKYLFSVEAVNALVNKGLPFREAYRQVGNDIEQNKFQFDISRGLSHSHEGSIGNLCTKEIANAMQKAVARFNESGL
jgi:argininosuccinate lyase